MNRRSIILVGLLVVGVLLAAPARCVFAQGSGPMSPPANSKLPVPLPAPKAEATPIPPEEMIHRFAMKEDEAARAIAGYTFQKSVRLEEIGRDNKPTGQVEIITQQIVSADGKFYQKPVRRSESTLQYMHVERGDADPIISTPFFPLTTTQLQRYDISFLGKQPLDELSVYIFSVKPRALERTHPSFSGVVWVDVQDLVIVKTIGKWVTDLGDVASTELPFTVFETYRQQVGKEWFPAYSRSDDFVTTDKNSVPVRMIIQWTNYTPLGNATPAAPAAQAAPAAPSATSSDKK